MSDTHSHLTRRGYFIFKEKVLRLFSAAGLFVLIFIIWSSSTVIVSAQSDEETKNNLRAQLQDVQQKIAEYQDNINEIKKNQKTLEREVSILDKQTEKQKLQIQEVNLSLREVEGEITVKSKEMIGLEKELEEKKILLNASLRKTQEYDQVGWINIFLSSGSISDFFGQVRYFQNLQNDINSFILNIDSLRQNLRDQKENLEDKRSDIIQLKNLNSLQKLSLDQKKEEKRSLLNQTKGEEKLFQANISKSKKDIALIKQQLFTLESVGVSMSFEEASEKAKFAGAKAGIRPAFLLAIFQVESRLGTYVGGGSWKQDMKPAERPLFQQITSKLGLDPDAMPVSKKPWYGWGGAMGAAQLIPSTWLAFEAQIASLTGHNPPSPWNIEDAFIGSAIKLSSNGASKKTYAGEFEAAARYLAGGNYKKKVAQGYASTVMDWANYYQNQIDAINEVGAAKSQTYN